MSKHWDTGLLLVSTYKKHNRDAGRGGVMTLTDFERTTLRDVLPDPDKISGTEIEAFSGINPETEPEPAAWWLKNYRSAYDKVTE